MSTIPITFNHTPSYTAVGGTERLGSTGLSAVILNRGAPYPRFRLFEELEQAGFDYVVSLEGNRKRYDLEGLSNSFPFVRFILPAEDLSRGEEINIAAAELPGPHFLVLWNDLRILRGGGAAKIAERFLSSSPVLCIVTVIEDNQLETIPTLTAPVLVKGKVKTIPFIADQNGLPSLFPFDGIGIYDRECFLRLGGFDRSLGNLQGTNPDSFYWQLMDFGFRSWLWGEKIQVNTGLKISYEGILRAEDQSTGDNSRRFCLKNLAPVFRGDYANLPLRRFPAFLWAMRFDILGAWEEFSLVREWVKTNRYRFRCDARAVTELWEKAGHREETISS